MFTITYNKVNYTLPIDVRRTKQERANSSASVMIKFPKDYPKESKLRTYPYIGTVAAFWKKETKTIYVDSFYLYALIDPACATKEELNSLRGIGKHILCLALTEVADMFKEDITMDTFVYLDASSLRGCIKKQDDAFVPYSESEIQEYFKDKIPSLTLKNIQEYIDKNLPNNPDEEDDEEELDEKSLRLERLELLCRIMNLSSLISYYKTYGFELMKDKSDTVLMKRMGAPLGKILEKCKEKSSKQTACVIS